MTPIPVEKIGPGVWEVESYKGETCVAVVWDEPPFGLVVSAWHYQYTLERAIKSGFKFTARYIRCETEPIECEAVGLDGRTTFCAARRGGSWGQGVEPVRGVFIATAQTEGQT